MSSSPYHDVPLNLPHATTIAIRLVHHLERLTQDDAVLELCDRLVSLLAPWQVLDRNPRADEAGSIIDDCARLGRTIVDECERRTIKDDRLGQAVRNLFECLELGEEGALISLRAGENPNSLLRPR